MDLIIENVESLTLNLTAATASPARSPLAEVLSTLGTSIRAADLTKVCPCPDCTAARAKASNGGSTREPSSSVARASAGTIPRLGALWPEQGGINAGLMRGVDGQPDFYLIVADGAAGEISDIRWAGPSCDSGDTGATSKQDGLANTKLLAESALDFPAAKWAASLTHEGHSDWYLPSQRELALCWANAPDAFAKASHWSSTQYSRYYAWFQGFVAGLQYYGTKSAELRARAVRRFIP